MSFFKKGPAGSEEDMGTQIKKIMDHLVFLEKKLDTLLEQSRSGGAPRKPFNRYEGGSGGGNFRSNNGPRSFNNDRGPRNFSNDRGPRNFNSDRGPRNFSNDRGPRSSGGSGFGGRPQRSGNGPRRFEGGRPQRPNRPTHQAPFARPDHDKAPDAE